tara:strand:- start:992 stop:1225 length:234 start_codon:yes stop_codon:yes gene_type:complete
MIENSSSLTQGQELKVDLEKVQDRLPEKLFKKLSKDPIGKLVGFKMVDGNQFGLVLELKIGTTQWFFEHELSEIQTN